MVREAAKIGDTAMMTTALKICAKALNVELRAPGIDPQLPIRDAVSPRRNLLGVSFGRRYLRATSLRSHRSVPISRTIAQASLRLRATLPGSVHAR